VLITSERVPRYEVHIALLQPQPPSCDRISARKAGWSYSEKTMAHDRIDGLILLGAGVLASVLLLVVTTYNGIAG